MTARVPADGRRYFFIHVMKTGGTSFVFHLLANFSPEQVYPSEVDKRDAADVEPYASLEDVQALSPARRAQIRLYAGHYPYMTRDLLGADVTALTLLRDPVDRTVSVLKHFKRLFVRYRDCSLDEVYDDEFVFRHFVENFQTRVFALTADDRPRSFASHASYRDIRAALDDPAPIPVPAASDTIVIDEHRFAIARANLAQVDVVGVSERFADFVGELQHRLGWWPAGVDPGARANVSTEDWDVRPSLRSKIALENAYDVELYRLASELASRRRD